MMQRLTVLAAFALAALFATAATAQEAPDALVKRVATEVTNLIKNDKDIQAGNKQKVKEVIETKLVPHFDFERMTALSMGRNWAKATPEQQKTLMGEFQTLLVRTYSGALSNYRDNQIDYKPLRMNPTDTEVVVHTQVVQPGGSPIPIDYSMEKKGDSWKAYDVTVGGVSLVTNYREEFSNTIKSSGVDGLIKVLADKNRGPAPPPAAGK
jgi:phospholipid transport system substrate-binding protein